MKRCSSLIAALLVLSTTVASADGRKILVLQSEGRVEPAQRAKIDAEILKVAKAAPGTDAAAGDTTMSDAAAAVGCKPEAQACREEIMGMLSVDELVYTSLTAKPGGTEVEVHRASKSGTTTVKLLLGASASPDKLDATVAPLFGAAAKQPEIVPPGTGAATVSAGTATPTTTEPPPATSTVTVPLTDGATPPPASVVSTSPTDPAGPTGPIDTPNRTRQRLELAGMIGGGALLLIGFMCWGSASDIQSQIDDAPTQTKSQIDDLRDLESRGDSYAAWGNVLFLGGAVLGGVSTYYFMKDRRARRQATSAHLAPAVFDHGAGLALTFGASP